MTSAPGTNTGGIETDFTTQMLYCAMKTGMQVNIGDLGLNVLYDLVEYSASIDALTLAKAQGKHIHYSKPMTVADMASNGNLRG